MSHSYKAKWFLNKGFQRKAECVPPPKECRNSVILSRKGPFSNSLLGHL